MMSTGNPSSEMQVNLMLADFAQVADGKLNVLGGGWSVTGPDPAPFALAGLFEVPWTLTNIQHQFRFELLDADGQNVMVETPDGVQPLFFEGGFGVPSEAIPEGQTQRVPFALNGAPLPLASGTRYEWRLTINGETRDDWSVGFVMRAPAPAA